MVPSSPARDEAFLGVRDDEVEGRRNQARDEFSQNAVVGVVDCDGAGTVNKGGVRLRDDEKAGWCLLRGLLPPPKGYARLLAGRGGK